MTQVSIDDIPSIIVLTIQFKLDDAVAQHALLHQDAARLPYDALWQPLVTPIPGRTDPALQLLTFSFNTQYRIYTVRLQVLRYSPELSQLVTKLKRRMHVLAVESEVVYLVNEPVLGLLEPQE
jgi:hypothetical protein